MKKELVQKLIEKVKSSDNYVVIHTNIARGRGINGVEYKTFHEYTDIQHNRDEIYYSVEDLAEDYVYIVETHKSNNSSKRVYKDYYIEYDSITMIVGDEQSRHY